jgi:HPt (histidine-containing phosphotransfer) domain-containing protein
MEEKLIDLEIALDRLGGDKEFLLELYNELNEQLNPTLEQILSAVESLDYAQLRSIAHGMKGASSNLGADRLSNYFKQLEKLGSNQNVEGADEIVKKIKLTHAEMLDFLKTI